MKIVQKNQFVGKSYKWLGGPIYLVEKIYYNKEDKKNVSKIKRLNFSHFTKENDTCIVDEKTFLSHIETKRFIEINNEIT